MARHLRNPKIESRAARAKLRPTGRPTYFDLGGKLHLGYRRGKSPAGVWVGRHYLGGEKYRSETLGLADDVADANGVDVLTFAQAQDKARAWSAALDRQDQIKTFGPVITVADAVAEYVASRRTAADARSKLRRLATLGDRPLAMLTVDDLARWREGLRGEMREASARRIAADARACLFAAARRHHGKLPETFLSVVRNGLAVPKGSSVENTREPQIMSDADVRRLVDAAWKVDEDQGWDGDLARMVLTLASTGARLSQLARVKVADLDVAKQRLFVPVSLKGAGEKTGHTAVPLLSDVVAALEAGARGRAATDALLLRPRWRRVPGGSFGVLEVFARGPWRAASELTTSWKTIVARAGVPPEVVAYSLRHSSITRALKAGLPAQLVAKLHNTSSSMIERFYGRYIHDALDGLARAALVPLQPARPTPLRIVEGG
jgi:integrase